MWWTCQMCEGQQRRRSSVFMSVCFINQMLVSVSVSQPFHGWCSNSRSVKVAVDAHIVFSDGLLVLVLQSIMVEKLYGLEPATPDHLCVGEKHRKQDVQVVLETLTIDPVWWLAFLPSCCMLIGWIVDQQSPGENRAKTRVLARGSPDFFSSANILRSSP